jgi:hypothetical protein
VAMSFSVTMNKTMLFVGAPSLNGAVSIYAPAPQRRSEDRCNMAN